MAAGSLHFKSNGMWNDLDNEFKCVHLHNGSL